MDPADNEPATLAYRMAALLPMELEKRQALLEMRSQHERREFVLRWMERFLPMLIAQQRAQGRAGGNGHTLELIPTLASPGNRPARRINPNYACALRSTIMARSHGTGSGFAPSRGVGDRMSPQPKNLGELRRSPWSEEKIAHRTVRQELRENLLAEDREGRTALPRRARLRRHGDPADRQRPSFAASFHSARPARTGEVAHPARPRKLSRCADSGRRRLRDQRQSLPPDLPRLPRTNRRRRRRHADRLAWRASSATSKNSPRPT